MARMEDIVERTNPTETFSFDSMIRLATFRQVVRYETPMCLSSLAESGFIFAGYGSSIKCVGCQRSVDLFGVRTDPSDKCYHTGMCPFATSGNQSSDEGYEGESDLQVDGLVASPPLAPICPEVANSLELPPTNELKSFDLLSSDLRHHTSSPYRSFEHSVNETGNDATGIQPNQTTLQPTLPATSSIIETTETSRETASPSSGLSDYSSDSSDNYFFENSKMDYELANRVGQSCSSSKQNQDVDDDDDDDNGPEDKHVTSPVFKVLSCASYPVYISSQKRLESFNGKAFHKIHDPEVLAMAGFFYAGYADCVRCFQCGLGLRSWKPGDDVYARHEKQRPNCPFLQAHRMALIDKETANEQATTNGSGPPIEPTFEQMLNAMEQVNSLEVRPEEHTNEKGEHAMEHANISELCPIEHADAHGESLMEYVTRHELCPTDTSNDQGPHPKDQATEQGSRGRHEIVTSASSLAVRFYLRHDGPGETVTLHPVVDVENYLY